jgi:deoxycytidine triphosphate deaminase
MVLTANSIRQRGLIHGGVDERFREASYDLTVGKLISPAGELVDDYILPPQGIVKVVSAECVDVGNDIIGFVSVKTGLCNEGLLALNIGIVDPGFAGPLQSSILNFGRSPFPLCVGDVFSRITFQQLDKPAVTRKQTPVTHSKAYYDARRNVLNHLSATFMDIAATAEKAAEQTFAKYKSLMFLWIPLAAIVLTLLTLFLNFGNMWLLQSYSKPQDQVRTELLSQALERRLISLEQEKDKQAGVLKNLQNQMSNQVSTAPVNKPPAKGR